MTLCQTCRENEATLVATLKVRARRGVGWRFERWVVCPRCRTWMGRYNRSITFTEITDREEAMP